MQNEFDNQFIDKTSDAYLALIGQPPASFVTSTVAVGSAVALAAGIQANITSISLPAGRWDVSCIADFNPAATTSITLLAAGLGTTSAVLLGQPGSSEVGTDPVIRWAMAANVPGANVLGLSLPPVLVKLATTTTIHFVAQATFTVSTLSVFGTITARRAI